MIDPLSSPSLVAVIDDDPSVRVAVQGVLKSVGLNVRSFASADEFLASGRLDEYDCIISDVQMPGTTGLQLQERLNDNHCTAPLIFITAFGDERLRMQAMKAGALDFLGKPFDDTVLIELVRGALEA